jgi:hypothetical protein
VERQAWAEKMRAWRLAASMDSFAELARRYGDAGVRIYAFKLALTESMPDKEYHYGFNVAKALGAAEVTMELNENTARIGRFAEEHRVHVGYDNHTSS